MGNGIAHTFAQCGYAVNLVDVNTWQSNLKTIEQDSGHALYPLLPFLLESNETFEAELHFSVSRTEQGLFGSGVLCAPVDEKIFNQYLADFVRQGFIDPAPSTKI